MSFKPTKKSPIDCLTDEQWEQEVRERMRHLRANRDFMDRIRAEADVIRFGMDNYIRRVAERGVVDTYSLLDLRQQKDASV